MRQKKATKEEVTITIAAFNRKLASLHMSRAGLCIAMALKSLKDSSDHHKNPKRINRMYQQLKKMQKDLDTIYAAHELDVEH